VISVELEVSVLNDEWTPSMLMEMEESAGVDPATFR
jgi:hypothetical protein